jgi:hypothetical protein
MSDKILRSGIPHKVSTSELTKDAINPRNEFLDNESNELKSDSNEAVGNKFVQSAEQSQVIKQEDSSAGVAKSIEISVDPMALTQERIREKKRLDDNVVKIDLEKIVDVNQFYESLHNVQDRLHRLRKRSIEKNLQKEKLNSLEDN